MFVYLFVLAHSSEVEGAEAGLTRTLVAHYEHAREHTNLIMSCCTGVAIKKHLEALNIFAYSYIQKYLMGE